MKADKMGIILCERKLNGSHVRPPVVGFTIGEVEIRVGLIRHFDFTYESLLC